MSLLPKLKLNFSKFPEGGLILVILVLGLLLTIFGGEVERPKIVTGPDGQPTRVMQTDANGQEVPVFVKLNKFFNAETLTQIAKDTSFFAIMAVGMTMVIITAGIDLSLALVEEDHGSETALAVARELVVYLKRSGGQLQKPARPFVVRGNAKLLAKQHNLLSWIA